MRKPGASLLLASALFFAHYTLAQTSRETAPKIKKDVPESPVTAPLGVGTAFNATLTDEIDTRKARTGDLVTATVAEDVKYERSVVFPKGTQIIGHIIRSSSSSRGRTGSALFLQFDKAVLQDGEEVIVNAGIQALALTSVTPTRSEPSPSDTIQDKTPSDGLVPVEEGSNEPSTEPQVVSTIYTESIRPMRDPLNPLPQGEIGADGLFSPDSTGAFGRPDVKIYTPTSDGSRGTVLLCPKKHMRLESGTRLLLVVQPPPASSDKGIGPDAIVQP